jgi:hypothetical protein
MKKQEIIDAITKLNTLYDVCDEIEQHGFGSDEFNREMRNTLNELSSFIVKLKDEKPKVKGWRS